MPAVPIPTSDLLLSASGPALREIIEQEIFQDFIPWIICSIVTLSLTLAIVGFLILRWVYIDRQEIHTVAEMKRRLIRFEMAVKRHHEVNCKRPYTAESNGTTPALTTAGSDQRTLLGTPQTANQSESAGTENKEHTSGIQPPKLRQSIVRKPVPQNIPVSNIQEIRSPTLLSPITRRPVPQHPSNPYMPSL